MGRVRITDRWEVPDAELQWRFSRASGPGGQHVNTSDSRVELSYDVERSPSVPEDLRTRALDALAARLVAGTLTVVASEHRSQLRNRQAARNRLAALLQATVQPARPERRATRPTRASRVRRQAAKQRRSEIKRLRSRPRD